MRKPKLSDIFLNVLTALLSSVTIVLLVSIFIFIFKEGLGALRFSMFTQPYWSENYYVSIPQSEGAYRLDIELENGTYYSSKHGIALRDDLDAQNEAIIVIDYIHPNSSFNALTNKTSGPLEGTDVIIDEGMIIRKISYLGANDVVRSAGPVVKQNAKETIDTIEKYDVLSEAFIQSQGGGILGSLIATMYLIMISLSISMPIGIMSAIYLNEYAKYHKMTPFVRGSIELLTGVPSIIYGLMGVLVLYPITSAFGASGTSILLGSMTLAIILLPTIIRTTEESLKVVPQNFREASFSLGANQTQTIFKIVLPAALPGILTATILGIGRVIGESAALIYTMGTFINDDPSLLQGATSLAVQIWSIMNGEQPNFALASSISIIILVMVLIMNISVKSISRKLFKRW